MDNLTYREARASARFAPLYLLGLVSLLCLLAASPYLEARPALYLVEKIGNAQAVALIFAISMVALLGLYSLILLSRLRKLEVARNVDSHAALHDALTGAANRRQFEQRLEQLVTHDVPCHALLMIDLDRFKPINDLYGHAAGDALLRDITLGMKRLVQHDDLVARLGGDEFAILLSNGERVRREQTAQEVLHFVTRFRLSWEGQRLGVGASIGLVSIDRPGMTPAILLAAADEALYAAKEAGRGAVFSADIHENENLPNTYQRLHSETQLPVSSARSHEPEDGRRQELHGLVMASPVDPDAGDRRRPHGARRRHEVRHWIRVEPLTMGDAISPGATMHELVADAAARCDGGADFARWVMAMALHAASCLGSGSLGRIDFVLPLPAKALVVVPDLADELMRSNALSHLSIRHLTFVLHGIGAVYDSPILRQSCHRLRESDVRLGFEIRSDNLDVLAPLRHIPFNELHLGRELIRKLRPGSADNATLDALQAVVDKSNTSLVAPSVDTDEEVRLLTTMGIKRFAGPVVGIAEPLHVILDRIAKTDAGMKA